jgi:hypothetical protein
LFFGFEWSTTHIVSKWLKQADHVMDEISRSLQWPVKLAEPLVSKPLTVGLFF